MEDNFMKRYLSIISIFLLVNLSLASVTFADTNESKDVKLGEKLKRQLLNLEQANISKSRSNLKTTPKLRDTSKLHVKKVLLQLIWILAMKLLFLMQTQNKSKEIIFQPEPKSPFGQQSASESSLRLFFYTQQATNLLNCSGG